MRGLDESGYYDFLQTDASINPATPGDRCSTFGPRRRYQHRNSRAANSIGFAVPINMVKELLPRLLKDGKIRRVRWRARGASAARHGAAWIERRHGALVRIVPGGPADRPGSSPTT